MGDIELQIFSERLKKLRSNLGITQKDFAERIGITAAALSSYENNLKNPSIAVAKKIAETFNISIDWLCGLSEKEHNSDEVSTYSDLIKLFVKSEFALKFHVTPLSIKMMDSVMQCFLSDWSKTLPLYRDGTIDEKLYKLWIDDKIQEFNSIHIGDEEERGRYLSIRLSEKNKEAK